MNRAHPLSDRGFTLVEMMVTVALSGMIVATIAQSYADTSKWYVHNKEQFQTQMRGLVSIDYISQELRNAGYIVGWDATPDSPPIAINKAITGAAPDLNTETLTVRYAQGPLTGAGAPVTTLTAVHNAGLATLTVQPLTFVVLDQTLVAIYSTPTTVNVRRVTGTSNVGATTISLLNPLSNTFNAGDVVAIVQESSFWIQGGNLWMRTGSTPNQQLSANVEDLQIALIDNNQAVIGDTSSAAFAGMTTAQLLTQRAVRLSLTARTSRPLLDRPAQIPPSLEDHNRSFAAADQVLRKVEQTTVYLRNFGVFDP